jgi:transposase
LEVIRAEQIRAADERFRQMRPVLDEQGRRRYVAMEALSLGHGGVSAMSRISGLARSTIGRGIEDIRSGRCAPEGRVRKPGAGRKRKTEQDPTLLKDLKALVDPSTRGDPMGPLLWTTRSLRNLVKELSKLGHKVSRTVVGELLHDLGYSLQANSKFYDITPDQMKSERYLAFDMGFPNAFDRSLGRTGTFLMVHGGCKSVGCYAMTDYAMDEFYGLVDEAFRGGQEKIQLEAFPFRLTAQNLARHADDPNTPFWRCSRREAMHSWKQGDRRRLRFVISAICLTLTMRIAIPANRRQTTSRHMYRAGAFGLRPIWTA